MVKNLTLNAPDITGLCSQISPLSPPFLLPLSSGYSLTFCPL